MREDVFLRLLTASELEAQLQSAPFFQVVMRELENVELNAPGCVDGIVTGQLPGLAHCKRKSNILSTGPFGHDCGGTVSTTGDPHLHSIRSAR